jgi:hypothetical protein
VGVKKYKGEIMKGKKFKHGKHNYKAYLKPAGKGFEVGFTFQSKPLFVGNFLYAKEANAWYAEMTKQVTNFTKKYWITEKSPRTFYNKFITQHLYKTYYKFLDKYFTKYSRDYTKEFNKHERTYKMLKKDWTPKEQVAFKKTA